MKAPVALAAPLGLALASLMGCAAAAPVDEAPVYKGAETQALDDELVNVRVTLKGGRGAADIDAYSRCAVAHHAQAGGYGFARHLRTNVAQQGGLWRGDAVYTVSSERPRGLKTIDAAATLRDCGEQGIPTI